MISRDLYALSSRFRNNKVVPTRTFQKEVIFQALFIPEIQNFKAISVLQIWYTSISGHQTSYLVMQWQCNAPLQVSTTIMVKSCRSIFHTDDNGRIMSINISRAGLAPRPSYLPVGFYVAGTLVRAQA